MADRRGEVERRRPASVKRASRPPHASRAAPRCRSRCTQAQPSVSQSSGVGIAAVGDEVEPFAIGDRPVGERVRVEQHLVARPLAIEGEAVAVMRRSRPALRGPRSSCSGGVAWQRRGVELAIGRLERIFGEGREDVRQHQFLMLLLVIDAELDQLERRGGRSGSARRSAASTAARQARTSSSEGRLSMPRRGRGVALALAFVIGVEQIGASARRRAGSPATWSRRTKVSKNQVVWARCHLAGEASGMRLDGRVGVGQAARRGRASAPRRR